MKKLARVKFLSTALIYYTARIAIPMATPMTKNNRRQKANAIRALSMDAVQKANSGHPGAPMGMADIAEVLWGDYLKHNPKNPHWCDRDRFVLSNGHASMLLYSLLHLSGYDLDVDEIKNFRQLHSKTPGHPEYGDTPGVETTTGPLGQGLANAVGMALAEKTLAAQFNRPGHCLVDHFTYVFVGDGCLMEGISHEVCSLAGTLKLGKLMVFYDDNGISIDGEVRNWFTDDTPQRFASYGWHVIADVDGHDADAVAAAIDTAKNENARPTLIGCKTIIGFGAPNKAGSAASHGAALGDDEVALARTQLDWQHAPFVVPDDVYAAWSALEAGAAAEKKWNESLARYQKEHPQLAAEFTRRTRNQLPDDFAAHCAKLIADIDRAQPSIASRKASLNALQGLAPSLPELIGGSADLAGSNLTIWSGSRGIQSDADGNYIYFGVREFGMAAIANGLALHGAFKTICRDLFDVLGLRAQRVAHGGVDEHSQYFYFYPRLGWPRRRWSHPSAGRATREFAADSAHGGVAAMRCGGVGGGVAAGVSIHRATVRADFLATKSRASNANRAANRCDSARRLCA